MILFKNVSAVILEQKNLEKILKKYDKLKGKKRLKRQPACGDINRRETSQVQTQKRSQGAEEGCKVLNSPAPSGVVIPVVFLPGEDLINAEKQTRSVQ